jgi:uncharacterized protein (TIGR02453 family)
MSVNKNTFDFLLELKENNSREWFDANRKRYEMVKANHEKMIAHLIEGIGAFENMTGVEVKHCNYRINRDVRFSKDKSPYKTWLAASFSEGGRKSGKMDYYLHIQPNNESFLGGGMYAPTPEHLAKFRQEIDYNAHEIKSIIHEPLFKGFYGEGWGESLKTMPKGYSTEHPDIDLLKRKQLFFMHKFTDAELQQPDFVAKVVEACRLLKPYLDFLNMAFFS